jgi:UDP-2,3-diacylglucosamine pyrophosphatase LpxH
VSTLVISDMHLGTRLERDVLRRPEALEALLAALGGVSRLVLLGDVVELLEGRPERSMPIAEPVLREIGARLGSDAEVVVVAGNHDRALVRPWLREHGVPSGIDADIPLDATPLLASLTSWLAPARVSVRYPGVWLTDRVWATHGHYLDRHLMPEVAYGIARGALGRLPRDGALPADYERPGGPSLTRVEALMTRWLPRPLAALSDDLAELVRAVTMPRIPRRAVTHRFSWLNAMLLGEQMRRASIPALARVAHRLGVDADWVIFGHVHRLGPLAADDLRRWSGPGGAPRIANTGSWIYEPLLLHHVTPPHPYWPGGAIVLKDGGEPEPIGLLDHLDAALLRRPPPL